jgi:hypothetical protein
MKRATSEMLNTSAELKDYNLFSNHSVLRDALRCDRSAADENSLTVLDLELSTAAMFALSDTAPTAAARTRPARSHFAARRARIFAS